MSSQVNDIYIQQKIRFFLNHHAENDRKRLLKILQDEVILLNEAVTCVNSTDKEALAALKHRLKGICCYLMIQIETIFCYPDSKFELMLIVQVLQNQIVVVLDEV